MFSWRTVLVERNCSQEQN